MANSGDSHGEHELERAHHSIQHDGVAASGSQSHATDEGCSGTAGISPLPVLLRPDEVADVFGVTPKTIHRWTRAGALASIKVGGSVRYVANDVRSLIRSKLAVALSKRDTR